jgi:hypothetical protein
MKKTVVGAVLESGVDERWRRDGRRAALECGRGYRLALFGLSTQACLSASR